MTNEERRPTGLLHSADELRRLIREYPALPLLVFAGEAANIGDYSYTSCSYINARKGEYLDCAQVVNDCMCFPTETTLENHWLIVSSTISMIGIAPMKKLTRSWRRKWQSMTHTGSPVSSFMSTTEDAKNE